MEDNLNFTWTNLDSVEQGPASAFRATINNNFEMLNRKIGGDGGETNSVLNELNTLSESISTINSKIVDATTDKKGIVQLANNVGQTSEINETKAVTPKAVYDHGQYLLQKASENIPVASLTTSGIVKLSNSTTGTSNSVAATESAVKAAYDHGGVTSVNGLTGAVTLNLLPSQGSTGQVLTKTDSGCEWADSGGGFSISDTAPTTTRVLWVDTTTGMLKYGIQKSETEIDWIPIIGSWG